MRALSLVLLAASLVGCGTESGTESGAGSGASGGSGIPHPTGAAEIVVDLVDAGGLTSPGYQLALQPELRVYGDGTVFVRGATRERGLVPLRRGVLTEEQVQEMLRAADDAGLLGRDRTIDAGSVNQPTDLSTTRLSITTDRISTRSAYGFGWTPDVPQGTPERDRLAAFVVDALALAEEAGLEPYVPEEVRIHVDREGIGRDADVPAWPDDLPPLAEVADGGSGCTRLTGPAAARAVDLWEQWGRYGELAARQGDPFTLAAATVLPGDRACR